jgi:hypothetical protein
MTSSVKRDVGPAAASVDYIGLRGRRKINENRRATPHPTEGLVGMNPAKNTLEVFVFAKANDHKHAKGVHL